MRKQATTALKTLPNPSPGAIYTVRFTARGFASICPVTGQRDTARLVVEYVPDALIIESASFEAFLASFEREKVFHEACAVGIGAAIHCAARPHWLAVSGYWLPRSGTTIDVLYELGSRPGLGAA